MHSLCVIIFLNLFSSSLIHCVPGAIPLHLTKNLTASLQAPDLSPLIYHIPNTHDTLLIRLRDYPLPFNAFGLTIREARLFIAGVLASSDIRPDTRLPPDKDPFEYPRSGPLSLVSITWQSKQKKYLTWSILAAAMKGLEDCLVKNDQLPWVATWHIFDEGQRGEVGWGTVGKGKGFVRDIATT